MPSHPLTDNGTYPWDLQIFERLKLKPFKNIPHGRETLLGEVDFDDATVTVYVTALPAQFWRFDIAAKNDTVKSCVLRTGSLALAEAWPAADLIARGMLEVTEK